MTAPESFTIRKHNLIQAMLAVNDMFYLAMPMVASLFYEDVVSWLDLYEIRYTPQVQLAGKAGYNHNFDFVVPKSKQQPERVLQTINKPGRDTAQSLAFAWIDTKEARLANSKSYAILNDQERAVSAYVIDALKSYEITPIIWTKRENYVQELAA